MYCDEGGDLFFSAVLPVASAARSNTAAWMAAVCTWYSVIIEWVYRVVYEHMMREIAGYVGMLFSVLVHTRSNNCRGNAVSSSSSSSSSSSAC